MLPPSEHLLCVRYFPYTLHILWLWKTGLREKLWNCSPFFENVFRRSCLQVTWISSCMLMSFSCKVDPFSGVEITVQKLISIHMVAKGWRGDLSSGNLTSGPLLLTSMLQLHYFMAKDIEMALLIQGHLAPGREQLKNRCFMLSFSSTRSLEGQKPRHSGVC